MSSDLANKFTKNIINKKYKSLCNGFPLSTCTESNTNSNNISELSEHVYLTTEIITE